MESAELNCIVTSLYLITEHNEFNPEKLWKSGVES